MTLWGSSFEGDWHPPYGPWVEALGEVARSLDPTRLRQALGRGAPVMARLLPRLDATLGDVPQVAALSPEEERFRLFEAVAQFLVAVALWEPVVLILDDLHWTDRDSLQLFAYCGHFVGRAPLVLVGAYRDVPPDLHAEHPLVDTLALVCREAGYEQITLGGLSHGEIADCLAAASRHELPSPLVRAIHAETGGNPFYVRQLWRHLVDERVMVHRDGRWQLAAEMGHAGVPHGVRHVVARRLARLSATARTVLHSAAALTAGFDFPVMRTVTELPVEALLGCLDEAVGAGLIHVTERPAARYDFVHPIIRHTLYEELNPDRRARLHRRLAEMLEHADAERPVDAGEIAVQYHASAALPGADRGLEHALRAAREATANTAHERAGHVPADRRRSGRRPRCRAAGGGVVQARARRGGRVAAGRGRAEHRPGARRARGGRRRAARRRRVPRHRRPQAAGRRRAAGGVRALRRTRPGAAGRDQRPHLGPADAAARPLRDCLDRRGVRDPLARLRPRGGGAGPQDGRRGRLCAHHRAVRLAHP